MTPAYVPKQTKKRQWLYLSVCLLI